MPEHASVVVDDLADLVIGRLVVAEYELDTGVIVTRAKGYGMVWSQVVGAGLRHRQKRVVRFGDDLGCGEDREQADARAQCRRMPWSKSGLPACDD